MRIKINHVTTYRYNEPQPYALQQVRLEPKSRAGQRVLNWDISVDGGDKQLRFQDEHANIVDLISCDNGATSIVITASGEVEVDDNLGVVGKQGGLVPLWLFVRETPLTMFEAGMTTLMSGFTTAEDDLATLHGLSDHVLQALPYSTDQTRSDLNAEQVLQAGHGVCQDHAHVFITAARNLGFPARYVSGYLMMDDRSEQDATHAWAEVHTQGLGWVGFDVSNGISPDARYVRVATGLDANGAAPISGMRYGLGQEKLSVKLQVQEQ